MKATGIVRRIDELGRVVIPKEIRRTLKIREGDPLEIFTERDGGIILKKYSLVGELGGLAEEFSDALVKEIGATAIVCDRDVVISASGKHKKFYKDSIISKELENFIDTKENIIANDPKEMIPVAKNENETDIKSEIVVPIICDGQAIGAIVLISKEEKKFDQTQLVAASVAANVISMQMAQ